MDVVLNRLAGCFGGSLEQRAHVNVKTAVGIAGGYHLGTAVVTVLAHLGDHDTGLTSFALGEFFAHLLSLHEVRISLGF